MDTFLLIGISSHLQGYKYLKDSIKLVMKDPNYINNVTKKLYPEIAKKHSTTAYRVERGIRHALDTSFTKGKMVKLNKLFGFDVLSLEDKPTNSEFVALIADKLNIDLK
jgi:two-component system response regulator (stage 0 sporulation protein A)